MRNFSQSELRFVARMCGGVALALLFAVFISQNGLKDAGRTASIFDSQKGFQLSAATALGDAQGVPSYGTGKTYPAYDLCYIHPSDGYADQWGPICDSPYGRDWNFLSAGGVPDTFALGIISIDLGGGSGRSVWETGTYTMPYTAVDGAPYCTNGGSWVYGCTEYDSYGACTRYGYVCSAGSPYCPYAGSYFDGSQQCVHSAGGYSGPSGNYAAGLGSISVAQGQAFTLEWSCLPSRNVYYYYHTCDYTFGVANNCRWNGPYVGYSLGLTQNLSGSWTNDPGFTNFAGQWYAGSVVRNSAGAPLAPGTYTYNLNCYGATYGMSINVNVSCSDNGSRSCSGNTVVNNCGSAVTYCGGATPICSGGSCVCSADNWSCGAWGACNAGTQTRTCSNSGSCYNTASPATSQSCNTAPRGSFDSASCTTIDGWAQDQDVPNNAISVHVYIDGGFAGQTVAGNYRGDLCTGIGSCYHGFSFTLPDSYKNSVAHSVNVYAIDSAGGSNPLLTGSPKSITCGPAAPPNAPTSMSNSCSSGTINLSWSPSGSGWPTTVYAVRFASSVYSSVACPTGWLYSAPSTCYKDNVTGTSVTIPGVRGATYSQSWIYAGNAAGWSAYTATPAGFTCNYPSVSSFLCNSNNTNSCGITYGSSVTLKYTVADAPTSATYSVDGGSPVAVSGFVDPAGTFSIAGLAVGSHTVTMTPNTGSASSPVTVTVSPATVSVTASDATATKNASPSDPGTYTISRVGDTTNAVQVPFTMSGDAINGTDYTLSVASPVTIPAGASSVNITLTPVNTQAEEATKAAIMTITAPANYAIGVAGQATVNLSNNFVAPPSVNLQVSDGAAGESQTGQGTGTFLFSRGGAKTNALTVRYTISGSAIMNTAYTLSGTCSSIGATSAIVPAGAASCTIVVNPIDTPSGDGTRYVVITIQP